MTNRLISQKTEKFMSESYRAEYEGKIYELVYLSVNDEVCNSTLRNEKGEEIGDIVLLELVEDFIQNEIVKTTHN